MDDKFDGFKFESSTISLEDIRQQVIRKTKSNVNQNPRNSFLDLVDSVSKISSQFRKQTDDDCQVGLPKWTNENRKSLAMAINETVENLVRLSNDCHIDLANAVVMKMEQNDRKYPVKKVYGLAKKYNEI